MQNIDTVTLHVRDDPDNAPLTEPQRATLTAEGWQPPGPGFGPMWTIDLDWRPDPDMFAQAAQTITWALRDVLEVPAPTGMAVEAFNVRSGDHFALAITEAEYARAVADGNLRQADLRLHDAAAAMVAQRQVPGARTVAVIAAAADQRPTREHSGEFYVDRILYVPGRDPHLLVWSHLTPTGQSGTRLVPHHPPRQAPYLRAAQGHPLYVRDLLQRNQVVAEALRADPDLHATLTALLASGRPDVVRAQRLQTSTSGTAGVSVTDLRLDADELDLATLRLPDLTNDHPAPTEP
jgi:hypothetical protein